MAAVTKQRIRVPSKKSLEFFMQNWNKLTLPVVNGEVTVPDPKKILTVDMSRVSHGITNIDTGTYDPATETVVADIVFTGPHSAQAIDEYVKGDIRFMPRCVRVRPPGGKDKDVFDSIITWDLVHRPSQNDAFDARIAAEKTKMRKEENDKDRLTEMIKKGKLQ